MFQLHKPTLDEARQYLATLQGSSFSYDAVGCIRTGKYPPRFNVDHHRVLLGHGADAFVSACQAVCDWRFFPAKVADIAPRPEPITVGTMVAVVYHAWPIFVWTLMPARILEVIDSTKQGSHVEVRQFGFTCGTLPGHWEMGEERFLVEWLKSDNSVWYDLLAVSRPRHWLARLGYWFARREQGRFRIESGLAMQAAVKEHQTASETQGATA